MMYIILFWDSNGCSADDDYRNNHWEVYDLVELICMEHQLVIIYGFIIAIVIKNKGSVSTPGIDKPVAEEPNVTPCPQGDKQQDAKMSR